MPRLVLVVVALAAAGCSVTVDYAGSAYRCAENGACPLGFECGPDDRCVLPGDLDPGGEPDAAAADAGAGVVADAGCGLDCPRTASVGSFVKATTADPALQVVPHQLGRTPALAIFWTSESGSGPQARHNVSVAVCDAARDCRAVAFSATDGASTANTARGIADQAVALVEARALWPTVTAAASVDAWDDASFTLEWSEQDDAPALVHYLLVGGDGVTSRLVRWTMPTHVGVVTVDGVGFAPDALVHLHTGHGLRDPAPYLTRDAAFGLGVVDASGAQWALTAISIFGEPGAIARRALVEGGCVRAIHADSSVTKHGVCTAMTGDGFVVEFDHANSYASQIATLAIGGVPARTGCFLRTAAATQAITGVGFRPAAVLLAGVRAPAAGGVRPDLRVGLGAASATGAGAIAISDRHGPGSATLARVMNVLGAAFLELEGTAPARAEAALLSLDADGFTLAWPTSDGEANQVCYLAIGEL